MRLPLWQPQNVGQARNQMRTVRLMQLILQRHAQILIIAAQQRTDQKRSSGGVIYCVLVRYSLGNSLTRKRRRQLAVGNDGNELQWLGRQQTQRMRLLLLHIADGEAAVQRRCHIIRVALDFRSDIEKLILV